MSIKTAICFFHINPERNSLCIQRGLYFEVSLLKAVKKDPKKRSCEISHLLVLEVFSAKGYEDLQGGVVHGTHRGH